MEELSSTSVFVYGREMDDFHTVDYDAISMLNVSATQEQQGRIEELEEMLKKLETEKASQQAKTSPSRPVFAHLDRCCFLNNKLD